MGILKVSKYVSLLLFRRRERNRRGGPLGHGRNPDDEREQQRQGVNAMPTMTGISRLLCWVTAVGSSAVNPNSIRTRNASAGNPA